jgi:hypothetical protein
MILRTPPLTLSKSRHAWSDARLVRECLSGSEEAWALLIEKCKALIYSVPVKYGLPQVGAGDGGHRVHPSEMAAGLRRRVFELGIS